MPSALGLILSGIFVQTAAPPRQLECLRRWYAIDEVISAPSGWSVRLRGGALLPFDDGQSKTAEQRFSGPDLQDMLAVPYRRGAAAPVTDKDDEPGRARVESLFDATYGPRDQPLPLLEVRLGGGAVRVHQRVAPRLERVVSKLSELAKNDPRIALAIRRPAGGHAARRIAGTNRTSAHAWGIAVDLDTRVADYWRWSRGAIRWKNRVPQAIIDAFEDEGFIWGGRWFHYDTMHFEYRPELLDPQCGPS